MELQYAYFLMWYHSAIYGTILLVASCITIVFQLYSTVFEGHIFNAAPKRQKRALTLQI